MKRALVLNLALALAGGGGAAAQEPLEPPGPSALARELATLNATLLEIRDLLRGQLETQGLELLMKRMELASSQAAELETSVRNVRSERASVEEERVRQEANLQDAEARIESGVLEAEAADLQAFRDRMEAERVRLVARLRDLDLELAELENRLAGKREELREWQDFVDDRLSGN